ncbi:MAG TPA: Zn-dependent hydrolase, partial [Thermoanaerobaculia bacterium]|nr:Zn-dependent hydrolase [Thermoanaerobaculia bacterium]
DFAKMPGAVASLAKELLEIEATGDRARAEAWFKRYEKMPPELKTALDKTGDIPVDIDPKGSFAEGVR